MRIVKTYVGHFSYSTEESHGHFALIVRALTLEDALDKFGSLIIRIRAEGICDCFDGIEEIFLDSCVEIPRIPRNGLMTYFEDERGEHNGSVNIGPVPFETGAASYYQRLDEDMDKPEEEPCTTPAFLEFRKKSDSHVRKQNPPNIQN